MTSDVEPAKKVLLPYLQRADELQKHEPLVAYYCRLYGMERGLKIPAKERTKTTNAILISLMNQLEKDKKSVQLSPEDNLYVEGFALNVFAKADKQDRAGRADLNTAKTFYAASIFIEILHQFGPLQPDIEQKQKYAVWKAADIRKALSEGRKPVPGPPGGDDELSVSPRQSIDTEVILNTAAGGLEGQSLFVRQASNAGVEIGSTSLDGEPKMSISRPSQPNHRDYYGSAANHGMPQPPHLDFSRSGHTQADYASSYPGSYHPNDTSAASPSMSASPHGSISQTDAYNSQPHSAHYQEYAQTAPSGHMYPNPPSTYIGNNGSPDAPYGLQGHIPNTVVYPASALNGHVPSTVVYPASAPQGQVPSTVAYPASAPFSADYSSFPGPSEPSGLGRTASAPAPPIKAHTYEPTPEKVAEAQKAARFAVSALAFDDVPTAVSYLKQSLELLTSPPI